MCGERDDVLRSWRTIDGSSPHVRGTLRRLDLQADEVRFIPACAGNVLPDGLPRKFFPVHPRMCGERFLDLPFDPGRNGSSPHVRGTWIIAVSTNRWWRFIPACAGNVSSFRIRAVLNAVHPRMCGERHFFRAVNWNVAGSSPHVRGTSIEAMGEMGRNRFIPACAGNVWPQSASLALAPVHPRMCGERPASGIVPISRIGSSPHVRGTCKDGHLKTCSTRFIPACAGNVPYQWPNSSTNSVHPRMCGERTVDLPALSVKVGSSPHVRGTCNNMILTDPFERFIPACAGNVE